MSRISIRNVIVATTTVLTVTAAAIGVSAWTEGPAPLTVAAVGYVAPGGGVSRGDQPSGEVVAARKRAEAERKRRLAAKRQAARKAAARKAAAAKAARRAAEARAAADRASRARARSGDPRAIARGMLGDYGWSSDQFSCLDALWTKESGWNPRADNPSSSAYGIPQALPGSKMASAGSDWETNPATQIEWGLGYIDDIYGSPCGAWEQSQAQGWY